jgi:hypothetical protein
MAFKRLVQTRGRFPSTCTYIGASHLEGKFPSDSRKWCIISLHYSEISHSGDLLLLGQGNLLVPVELFTAFFGLKDTIS